MADLTLETDASVPAGTSLTLTLQEDANDDGVFENENSTPVTDGASEYTLSGFDGSSGNDIRAHIERDNGGNVTARPQVNEWTVSNFDTFTRSVTSTTTTMSTASSRLVELTEEVGSHSASFSSFSTREIATVAPVGSHATAATASSDRDAHYQASPASSVSTSESLAFNERVSLELIDFDLTWVEADLAWYTTWFQETRILGSEEFLSIRGMIVDGAKDPAATVVVEYSDDGGASVTAESEPIDIDTDGEVKPVRGIPVDENGHYRLKITNYSGYNSLYQLDTGLVH